MPEQLYDIIHKASSTAASPSCASSSAARSSCEDVRALAARPGQDPGADARQRPAASADVNRVYRNQREHDPLDLDAAREIASCEDPIPSASCTTTPPSRATRTCARRRTALARADARRLEAELDKYTIWPEQDSELARAA